MTYVEENLNEKVVEEKNAAVLKLKSPAAEKKTTSKINDLLEVEEKPTKNNNENQNYLFDLIDIKPENNEKKDNANNDLLDFTENSSNVTQQKDDFSHDLVKIKNFVFLVKMIF